MSSISNTNPYFHSVGQRAEKEKPKPPPPPPPPKPPPGPDVYIEKGFPRPPEKKEAK